jgi:hypothetical protein
MIVRSPHDRHTSLDQLGAQPCITSQ